MVVWSAVIFLLDSKSSIQRGAQNVAWKEKYRTQQPKISIFLPALKELVVKYTTVIVFAAALWDYWE